MKWTRSLAITLLWCAAEPAIAAYQVDIEAPKPVQSLLKDFLDLSRYQDRDDISDEQLKFMMDTAGEQVRDLTATEGYFTPVTKVSEESAAGKDGVRRITVTVDPGPRTLVESAEISVTGSAASQDAARVAQLRTDWSLGPGEPFRQQDWDKAKNAGLATLQQKKYAAARIADSEARIDPQAQQADLSVRYDSGPAFTLGALQMT
ncbi:autotransporter assembly complex protein TamA, partial [Herbaspirillum seropedicae]|uniref:autotransporter assembly complex protein TamA n=1 Tax=Herbaspirillum seropedicae TaxID=964 RepID=UPI003CD08D9D